MTNPEETPPALADDVGSRDFHPHPGDLPELGEWSFDEVLDAARAAADAVAGRHARIPAPRKATS